MEQLLGFSVNLVTERVIQVEEKFLYDTQWKGSNRNIIEFQKIFFNTPIQLSIRSYSIANYEIILFVSY